jgi:GcrA cell cycle regulator
MNAPAWTDERISQLRVLWDEGLSASLIGERMGITRNAVIGKADRLDLPSRKSVTTQKRTISVQRRKPRTRFDGGIWSRIDSMLRAADNGACDLPLDSSPHATTIENLLSDTSQCRYPVTPGESFLYCGADAVKGLPYCPRHCDVCYTRQAKPFAESTVKYFQSVGSVASRVVDNLEQHRRDNDRAA